MQAVASTPLAIVISLLVLYFGPRCAVIFLFATMPLGATAAFLAPGFGSVTLTDFCVLMLCLSMVGRVPSGKLLVTLLPPAPGFALLVLLLLAALGAVFLPQVFLQKTEVFAIVPGDPHPLIKPVPLAPSGSNMAQLVRLTLAVICFVTVAAVSSQPADRRFVLCAVGAATCIHIVVSLADWLTAPLGLEWVLKPLRTVAQAVLVDQTFAEVRRLIGGHTEPASFGLYTMGLYGIWLRLAVSPRRCAFASIATGVLAVLALRSTSTATIVNLGVFTAFVLLGHFRTAVRTGKGITFYLWGLALMPVMVGASIYFYAMSGTFADLINVVFLDKTVSVSGQERLSWNARAL